MIMHSRAQLYTSVLVVVFLISVNAPTANSKPTQQGDKVKVRVFLQGENAQGELGPVEGTLAVKAHGKDTTILRKYVMKQGTTISNLEKGRYTFSVCPDFTGKDHAWTGQKTIEVEQSRVLRITVHRVEMLPISIKVVDTGKGKALSNASIGITAYPDKCPLSLSTRLRLNENGIAKARVFDGCKYQLSKVRSRDFQKLLSPKVALAKYVGKTYVWQMPYTGGAAIRLVFHRQTESGETKPFTGYHSVSIETLDSQWGTPVDLKKGEGIISVAEKQQNYSIQYGQKYRIRPHPERARFVLLGRPVFKVPERKLREPATFTWRVKVRNTEEFVVRIVDQETDKQLERAIIRARGKGPKGVLYRKKVNPEENRLTFVHGAYILNIQADGYLPRTVTWVVDEDFRPDPIALRPYPVVQCRALDRQGNAVPAHFLVLYGGGESGDKAKTESGVAAVKIDTSRAAVVLCSFLPEEGKVKGEEFPNVRRVTKIVRNLEKRELTFEMPLSVQAKIHLDWQENEVRKKLAGDTRVAFLHTTQIWPTISAPLVKGSESVTVVLQPGEHKVYLWQDGKVAVVGDITVSRDGEQELELEMKSEIKYRKMEDVFETRLQQLLKTP